MISLIQKMKALTEPDWVKGSRVTEDSLVEDFKSEFVEGAGTEAVTTETIPIIIQQTWQHTQKMKTGTQSTLLRAKDTTCTMTETGRWSLGGWTPEDEDAGASHVEGRDSSSVKPTPVPLAKAPSGFTISSRSTGSKAEDMRRRRNRTTNKEDRWTETILEHLNCLLCCYGL